MDQTTARRLRARLPRGTALAGRAGLAATALLGSTASGLPAARAQDVAEPPAKIDAFARLINRERVAAGRPPLARGEPVR